jgi:hypothetical protein
MGWPVKVAGQSGSIREYDGKIPFYLNVIRGLLRHFSSCSRPSTAAGRRATAQRWWWWWWWW